MSDTRRTKKKTNAFDLAMLSAMIQEGREHESAAGFVFIGQRDKKKLSREEWDYVHEKNKERFKAKSLCGICHENFGAFEQCLTSCGHCFHLTCLESFEKFCSGSGSGNGNGGKKQQICPYCRRRAYRKIRIDDARKETRHEAAVMIQKHWLGYRERSFGVGPASGEARKMFLAKKLRKLRKIVEVNVCNRRGEDDIVNHSEDDKDDYLDELTNDELSIDWDSVVENALLREDKDCAICTRQLYTNNKNTTNKVSYLSCSHRYHLKCLKSFENHNEILGRGARRCPMCRRENYARKCF